MNPTKVKNDPDCEGNDTGAADTNKSSMQILSELFSTFDAEPPIIVKKEKKEKSSESSKKSKKSKKKRKRKEKKHKKKSKKKKRSTSSSSSSSSGNESEIDLAKLLIKQEKDKADEKIKIEGTSLSLDIKLEINKEEQKIKSEKSEKSDRNNTWGDSKQKIHIKEVQLSSLQHEDGELTESENDIKKKKKHRSRDKEKSKKRKSMSRERSRSKEKKLKHDREKISPELNKYRHKSHHDSKDRDLLRSSSYRTDGRSRDRSRSRDHYRDDYRSRYKDKEYYTQYRDDSFYKFGDRSRSRSRERIRSRSRERWLVRDRYRSLERKKSRHSEESSRIDKKKLLEIARRNAIQMMKSGSLPGALSLGTKAQEKMIDAIKSGGKTIAELTDFCKSLSRKEELGELSSLSEKEESDTDEPFHHPFKIKDRPTTITMNIKNSVPLPVKTTHERTTELRMQFPVSSGQQHRINEEWVPVSPPHPKLTPTVELAKPKIVEAPAALLPIEPPPLPQPPPFKMVNLASVPLPPEPASAFIPAPPNAPPGPQVFPTPSTLPDQPPVDISSIVSQRLTAMRKLQENPNDVQALNEMYKSNKDMESWARSKQQLGQFTGSTGAQVLTQAELASGFQAWAKKDQLQTAAPVSGGMGMHLLQKMGWKPGEGLGKEKSGALEPLLLEVKLDKKGLVATEENSKGRKKLKAAQTVKTLQGKHPVSLLGEYASKRKLGAPQYILDFECGPDHKKNFVFKVVLNGVEYRPDVASATKKEAKANAATLALKQIGLLV